MATYALRLASRRKESGEGQHESNEKSTAQNKKTAQQRCGGFEP
ncbi:hypothetical protein [Paraburkholderia sp. UCT2]|nr:hypothetical protein [Paraburkholderia sp. UCT2]